MPYTLTDNQTEHFRDLCDLYRQQTTTDPVTKRVSSVKYGPAATSAAVKCQLVPKSEASIPAHLGRSNTDMVVTTDVLRLHVEEDIDDGWAIQLKSPGHPEFGTWFVTQGGVQTYLHRAKTKLIFLKRSTKPPGVA